LSYPLLKKQQQNMLWSYIIK